MVEHDFEYPVNGAIYLIVNRNYKDDEVSELDGCFGCQLVYKNEGFSPVNRVKCCYFGKSCFIMEDLDTNELPPDWFIKQFSGFEMKITGQVKVIGEL